MLRCYVHGYDLLCMLALTATIYILSGILGTEVEIWSSQSTLTHPERGFFFTVASRLTVNEQKKKKRCLVCKTVRLPHTELALNSLLASVQVNTIIIVPAFPLLLCNSIIDHL